MDTKGTDQSIYTIHTGNNKHHTASITNSYANESENVEDDPAPVGFNLEARPPAAGFNLDGKPTAPPAENAPVVGHPQPMRSICPPTIQSRGPQHTEELIMHLPEQVIEAIMTANAESLNHPRVNLTRNTLAIEITDRVDSDQTILCFRPQLVHE